jgi:DNA processing protein
MEIHKLPKENFPAEFFELPQPPKNLWIMGEWPVGEYTYLCVVGSRKHTSYGRDICEKIIDTLRGYPVVIVSGFAMGIDTIAHNRAIENGLKTIVFPGSGLDKRIIYPKTNVKLIDKILENDGCLVSEFPPLFKATQWGFPMRNRLMAGLCKATLIIEAEEKSGTLITARLATEYNKDVLVVPGSVFSPASKGTNYLLKQGATPITKPEDILEALGFDTSAGKEKGKQLRLFEDLSKEEKHILELLREPLNRDELIRASAIAVNQANAIISAMEIRGIIKEEYGEIRVSI